METLGLVHTPRVGTTQIGDYDFDSACILDDGTIVGGNPSGLYLLDEADDDDGTAIAALAEWPRVDFGIPNQKRVRSMHVGLEASGLIEFFWAFDESNWYSEYLRGEGLDQKSQGLKVPGRRFLKGRYLRVKIENINGADFSIDAIDALVTILAKRMGRSRFFKPYLSEYLPVVTCAGTGS